MHASVKSAEGTYFTIPPLSVYCVVFTEYVGQKTDLKQDGEMEKEKVLTCSSSPSVPDRAWLCQKL